jgi:hypothetical protein
MENEEPVQSQKQVVKPAEKQPLTHERWEAVRKSFIEDGITNMQELATIHGINTETIRKRRQRERWVEKREGKFKNEDASRAGKEDAGTVREQVEAGAKDMLKAVTRKIRQLSSNPGSGEMMDLIGALKNLQGMLDGVIKPEKSKQIDVDFLTANIEAADKYMAAKAAKRIAEEEAKRLIAVGSGVVPKGP